MSKLFYCGQDSRTPQELFTFLRTIKSREWRSNSVFTAATLEELYKKTGAWISLGARAAVILIPDTENIVRLFYYASDVEALAEIPTLLPTRAERIVCDIIGKGGNIETQVQELQSVGFSLYAKFQRMSCISPVVDEELDFSKVTTAAPEDLSEIYELLRQEFDPLTARFPSVDVISQRIENEEVFVVRKKEQIAGFAIFSSGNKKVALLEYIIVRPSYRNEKIAKTLVHYKWKYRNLSQHYFLWINSQCFGPIQFHQNNGFQEDGTYDYIMVPNHPNSI